MDGKYLINSVDTSSGLLYSTVNWNDNERKILMSRNKLYSERIELCLTKEQKKIVIELAKKRKKRMNEVIREAIEHEWEEV
jgi:hypothetical protein